MSSSWTRFVSVTLAFCTLSLHLAANAWTPLPAPGQSVISTAKEPTVLGVAKDARILVTGLKGSKSVAFYHPDSGVLLGTTALPKEAVAVSLSDDGTRAYALYDTEISVAVINTSTRTVVATWRTSGSPVEPDAGAGQGMALNTARNELLVLDKDGKRVIAISTQTGAVLRSKTLTRKPELVSMGGNATVLVGLDDGQLVVLDAATLDVSRTIALGEDLRALSWWQGTAGARALAVTRKQDALAIIDTTTGQIARVPLSDKAEGLEVEQQDHWAYVTAKDEDTVSLIDLLRQALSGYYTLPGPTGNLYFDASANAGAGALYVTLTKDDKLLRLDPNQASLLRKIAVQKTLQDVAVNNITHEALAVSSADPDFARVKLSDRSVTVLALPDKAAKVAVDPARNLAIVGDTKRHLVFVNLATTPASVYPERVTLNDDAIALAVDAGRGLTVVGVKGEKRIELLNNQTRTLGAGVTLPEKVEAVALHAGKGLAYIITDDKRLRLLNLDSRALGQVINLSFKTEGIAVDEALNLAVLVTKDSDRAHLLDLNTLQWVANLPVPKNPVAVAIQPDTHIAVVVSKEEDRLSLIDLETRVVTPEFNKLDKPTAVAVSTRYNQALVVSGDKDALTLVQLPNKVPTLTVVAPSTGLVGSPDTLLTLTGSQFVEGSVVLAGAQELITTWVSSTQLTATLPASLLTSAATLAIRVSNPGPGGGVSAPLSFEVRAATPILQSVSPTSVLADGTAKSFTLTGQNFSAPASVLVDGAVHPANLVSSTAITVTLPGTLFGAARTINLAVRTAAGDSGSAPVTVRAVLPPPAFVSLEPSSPVLTRVSPLRFTGRVSGATQLMAGSTNVTLLPDGSFAFDQTLQEGQNTINLVARNADGVEATRSVVATLDTLAPQPVVMALVNVTNSGGGSAAVRGATGSAEPALTIRITNLRTNAVVNMTVAADGSFTSQVVAQTGDNLQLVLVDAAGNISPPGTATVPAPAQNLPPDPATVAPPVERGVTTLVSESTAFLYTGPNPIQTNVVPGAIEARRAAVIRGRTLSRNGAPLTGVTISVMSHPELGKTLTRADGMFDLAVNGGGEVIVRYEKLGHLPAQRAIKTRWQAFASADDVVLIELDANATTVSLPSATGRTAHGSVSTDADGSRQATVFFPPGTTAEMLLPNGITQQLASLTVRATEYTVGANGPQAMPGPLPPASGYTYAVELSVDEAITVGAKEVRFSQPVPLYVDNFLRFPVGTIVPAGYFDRDANAWISSNNGIVIKVVGNQGGLALIDYSGDDVADDAAAIGMTDAEREMVATRFAMGQSAWRVLVPHFTPWDCNWPFGLPPDAREPQLSLAGPEFGEVKDECDGECGSIIEVQNRVLKEQIVVTGTPHTLHYGTDRIPSGNQVLRIPVSGFSVPSSLQQIELKVEVAGQVMTQQFPPAPNQATYFSWNGKDGYGRAMKGAQQATIRIAYKYRPVSYSIPAAFEQSFARFGTSVLDNIRRTDNLLAIFQEYSVTISPFAYGGFDAKAHQDLGGWTLNEHHVYDPIGRVLHMGNGRKRSAESLNAVIATLAGTGAPGFAGDGIPASESSLSGPQGVTAAPDGSIYIADSDQNRIRKVSPTGIITTIAGTGNWGYSGDGGPATSATLRSPTTVTLGPDGSVYFVDIDNSRVRKVGLDGTITTVAGNGQFDFYGDGGPADMAALNSPGGLAVAADGTLYIADTVNQRIRRVGLDGIISTIAGRSPGGFSGDGGPATDALLNEPRALALDANGNLHIVDVGNFRIRRIASDGTIRTVVMTSPTRPPIALTLDIDGALIYADSQRRVFKQLLGQPAMQIAGANGSIFAGDGVPALQSPVRPAALAMMPDGTLLLAEDEFNRVRVLRPTLPGFDPSDLIVAGPDGIEAHVFNQQGRHLRTHHAMTGAVLRSFGYVNGILSEIRDGDGNVTRIERGANGVAQAIVSADNQRTTLAFDANGWLERITNPESESFSMASEPNGLLKRFTSPRNFSSTFEYESNGLLKLDRNAAQGQWAITQTNESNGRTVVMTSAEGRETYYQVETLANGDDRRTTYFPDGTEAQKVWGANHVNTHTDKDGTVTTETEAPDPRFGMQSAFVKALSVVTPSGLTLSRTTGVSVALADPRNPLSLATETTTVTENGRITRSVFDAATRQTTITSPQNRVYLNRVDAQGRTTMRQVPNVLPLQMGYDARGRLETMTQGSGADQRSLTYRYGADGFVDLITDAETRETLFVRDAIGRVRQATLPGNRVLGLGFDAASNFNSLTPPGKPAHSFDHTPVDLVSEYSPPQAGLSVAKTTYGYNLDKQLTTVTRPDGFIVTLGYQPNGRLETATPSGNGDTVTYGYHPATGKLNSVATAGTDAVTVGMTFDGFLAKADTVTGALVASLNRGYDTSFRLNQMTIAGVTHSLGYDNDDLLTQAGSLILTRRPDNGFISGTTLGVVTTEQTYNAFGEIETFTAKVSGTPVYGYTLTYDKLGRIKTKTETVQGIETVHEYGYDLAGRLETVKANGVTLRNFTYDGNGNRTHVNGVEVGTYDDQDRLQTYAGATFEYGANGELKRKTQGSNTTLYRYDVFGNLKEASLPNATTLSYIADGIDRRIGKKANGAVTKKWLYQDQLRIAAELDASNQVTARFIHGTKANVPEYLTKGTDSYRIITDHLGSVRLVINSATAQIVQAMLHDEWGNTIQDTNPGFQPFGYAGGLYDADTKLVRFGARDYDPETGRWTAKDPIGFDGGDSNLFVYVGNEPTSLTDASGLQILDPAQRHAYANAIKGEWNEVIHTLKHATGLTEQQIAKIIQQCASKRGNQLVKEFKDAGTGAGARSGQHGVPYSRAGAELQREANTVNNPQLAEAMKNEAARLIAKGRGINH